MSSVFRYPLIFWGSRAGTRSYLRSTGSPEAEDDPFALDLSKNPELKKLYLDCESADGYHRDQNVFGQGIEIPFPQRVVHINYDYKENSKANIS